MEENKVKTYQYPAWILAHRTKDRKMEYHIKR
jgi:hypothetical protein